MIYRFVDASQTTRLQQEHNVAQVFELVPETTAVSKLPIVCVQERIN
jgi:hypothetical protein